MLIGHQKQWNFLKRAAENGKFPHAYLFCGQEKLGKRTLALEWVSFLFRQDVGKSDLYQATAEAEKNEKSSLTLANHPDLVFIESQGKEIQISQIRDLIRKLSFKSSFAETKVAIIDNAHLMNEAAQTSLLKTLEEPRGKALLILISDKAQYLFPTIRSRVQTVKFYPVKKEEIKKCLLERGVSEKESEKISEISMGRPGLALDFISGKEKLENLSQKITDLNRMSNSPLCLRFQYVKSLAEDPEAIKDVLDIWLNHLRIVLLSRFTFPKKNPQPDKEDKAFFSNSASQASSSASGNFSRYSTIKIKNIIERIQAIKFLLLSTNVNPRLALETLMIELNS